MSDENKHIIDTKFQEIKTDDKVILYTIEEISQKLKVSETKILHLIFKFNKTRSNFFKSSDRLSQDEIDVLDIALDLLEEKNMSYDEVIEYFNKNMNNLINKETGEIKENLSKIDSQVIAKNITIEVDKRINKLETYINDTIVSSIKDSFKEEAMKIAKSSLEAVYQIKDDMISTVNIMSDDIKDLKKENHNQSKELERLYSKDTERMRNTLNDKQKEIENLKKRTRSRKK